MEGGSPTLRRRRLGLALRRLREDAQLTGEAAASALERSASWMSRVESGRVGVRGRDLRDLFELYHVPEGERRRELEELAREGKRRGWWSRYSDALPEPYFVYIGLEDEATGLSIFHNTLVPGLLQSEEYARAVCSLAIPPLSRDVLEARVEVRMARQRLLEKDPPLRVVAVLDEAVLHRVHGSRRILYDQLGLLVAAAHRQSVDIRVLPFDQEQQVVVFGSFHILEFARDPSILYIETLTGGFHQSGDAVDMHEQAFDNVRSAALDPEQSVIAIERARARLA